MHIFTGTAQEWDHKAALEIVQQIKDKPDTVLAWPQAPPLSICTAG